MARERYRSCMEQVAVSIMDVPEMLRYEARTNGDLTGFVDYRWMGGRRVLLHTEVLPAFAGRGVGSALARHVLEEALASGTRVTVKCPFIRAYMQRDPAYESIATTAGPIPQPETDPTS